MKRVAMGLALALAASTAFAGHANTINKTGFAGVNKTQSAQSLGHSKLVFTALGDFAFGNDMFKTGDATQPYAMNNSFTRQQAEVADYLGVSAYVGLAIGLLDYFDIGVTMPVYYDRFKGKTTCRENPDTHALETAQGTPCDGADLYGANTGYIGNLTASIKARAPIPADVPIDFAAFFRYSFHTAKNTKQGVWIREPEFIMKDLGYAFPFGSEKSVMTVGGALTFDLSKVDVMPLLVHVNGGYRMSMDKAFLSFPFVSAALEFYVLDFLSFFGEFYMDLQTDDFVWNYLKYQDESGKQKLDMKQITGAAVFHLPVGLDLQIGASFYMGNDNYINYVNVLEKEADDGSIQFTTATKTRVNPSVALFGGLTWSGFLMPQDRDGDGVADGDDRCPDDYGHRLNSGCPMGNPDSDEDGVCDAWVSEKGMLDEFRNVCEGIDQCPNEKGNSTNGCPTDDPDPDKDGVCDSWVSQKGQLDQFKEICEGIDQCPAEAGTLVNNGCPEDNPDPDGDGLCSPWVTDKNKLDQYAGVCKGYDMCPGEAGAAGNKGCPWDDPDSDGDGICDEWVVQKKLGYYFEKAAEDESVAKEWFISKTCKGLDKCPLEHGVAANDGCPLPDPDLDKDGVCDAWVTERNMFNLFEGVCAGMDRCPNEAGDDGFGCPKKKVEKLEGISFKSGSATVNANAKRILKGIAQKLKEDEAYKDLKIVIQGHTDNRGKAKKNLKLSDRRAKAVMKQLTKFGVAKNRIKAIGLGSTCPVDDNSTADGREMNRRIEMHFVTPENDGMKCESNYVGD
ncbi:OmpA family protein [Fibrobacter sp. UWB16]|uniref:OmpA family protein n=1 Tax=Fibrobacter sp. UWB16 TaxID=1945874 RepID=UPI000BC56EE5|nr:OmpA family protein [Fibrobacter sp. UWB16]SOD11812.1 OmpA family protein [Fibrobacter sp. UWB16]